jgi:hypothetical protein
MSAVRSKLRLVDPAQSALTVQAIAKEQAVSEATVMNWINKGHLKAHQFPGSKNRPIWRVPAEEYRQFLAVWLKG